MTRTVVDTSALVALLYPDEKHNRPAANLLHQQAERGSLLINSIVYAELAGDAHFQTREALDAFLEDTGIVLERVPRAAQFEAGSEFHRYLERRGTKLQCSACGDRTLYRCPACESVVTSRQHIAADFLIGAHATTADALLTFDAGFFRDYFDVEVISIRDE